MDTKISERTPIKWWINRQPKAIAQTGIGYIAVANYKEEDDAIPCVEFSEYESKVNKLEAENARLREALEFTLQAAERLYKPEKPLWKNLDPTFYHTLTWEGDLELIEKTKKAREALNDLRKGGE